MDSATIFRLAPDAEDGFARRNQALCNFLMQKPVSPDDFVVVQRMRPGNRFARCLGYLSIFQCPDAKSFKSWVSYSEKVVKAAGDACERSFENDYELRLFAYALAVRTFPDGYDCFNQLGPFNVGELQGIASLKIDSDERVWAMYVFGNAVLDYLSTDASRDFHTFLRLMISLATAKEKYSEVDAKLPHFNDMNIGVFVNADQD